MHCVKCGHNKTRVYAGETRNGISIRYRKCVSCGTKFKTKEVVVDYEQRDFDKNPIIFEGVYDDIPS